MNYMYWDTSNCVYLTKFFACNFLIIFLAISLLLCLSVLQNKNV